MNARHELREQPDQGTLMPDATMVLSALPEAALGDAPRIAIISDAEPARNGVGAYYQDLAEHLQAQGRQVRLFCPMGEDSQWSAAMTLPLPGDASQRFSLPNPFLLNAGISSFRPDIALLATPGAYGLTGAFLCRRMNLPVLVGFHTPFEQLARLYWKRTVMSRVVRQYFRNSNSYLFDRCDKVVVNCRDMQRLAKRLGAQQVDVVGTLLPKDFIDFRTRPHSGRVRKVLFAGRLAAEKNIAAIIRAAQAMPELSFSLAGDGPLRAEVEKAAGKRGNLTYLGWLSRDDLRQTLDRHDLLILPSQFESFGNIALEAMSRERLALVTRQCGIAKWPALSDGLHVIDSSRDLETALRELSTRPNEQIRAQAATARAAAVSLNDESLEHWCKLLDDMQQESRLNTQA